MEGASSGWAGASSGIEGASGAVARGAVEEALERRHSEQSEEEGDETAAAGPALVELDIGDLERAVAHLLRSNEELAAFLAEQGPDAELEQALRENAEAVEVKRTRIADLRELRSKGILPTFLSAEPSKAARAVTVTYPSGKRLVDALALEKEREEAAVVARDLVQRERERAEAAARGAPLPSHAEDEQAQQGLGIML